MTKHTAVLLWGTQLSIEHQSALKAEPQAPVIMIESLALCRRRPYHQQKLRFMLTAMRDYADELRSQGRTVYYSDVESDGPDWFEALAALCRQHQIGHVVAMRQNDRAPQARLAAWCKQQGIGLRTTPNELFLTSAADFQEWAAGQKRLQLEQFYRWQRQRLDILMEQGKPAGGSWNYDAENRKPLPKGSQLPVVHFPEPSRHSAEVTRLVRKHFADHPGSLDEQWLPTSRRAARQWLREFIQQRFSKFGDYEDAMQQGETFLYHSALSAMLNVGLLSPHEVVAAAVAADVPLAAKEGFVRQVIGWREFMFGLYHYKPLDWRKANYFGLQAELPAWWWQLRGAPELPLEDALQRLERFGYSHHIERLMVFGNYMLLSGYRPQAAMDWFMAMYVDAYDWVMVPNVIGMSQYADGGLDNGGFASKPYLSGSNYLQKMGRWWPSQQAAKDSDWTRLYWQFLKDHRSKLQTNHRLAPLLRRIP